MSSGPILVLDDEENYARMVQDLLLRERYEVEMVTRPEEALQNIREREYALLVADYKMPVIDGAQVLQEARRMAPDMPVIMISGLMNTPELVKVANMGVTVVMEKPLEVENFLQQVRRFVEPPSRVRPGRGSAGGARGGSASAPSELPELKYFVAQSEGSLLLAEAMHALLGDHNHLFVRFPRGCEFGLLVNEVSRWQGFDAKRSFFYTASQLLDGPTRAVLQRLPRESGVSNVVAITDLADLDADQQEALAAFVAEAGRASTAYGRLSFLYALEEEGSVPAPDWTPALAQVMEPVTLRLPPLRERPADLATYARRYLARHARRAERPGKTKILPEAAAVLLGYDWPGNFRELTDVLKAAVLEGEEEGLHAADLQAALAACGASLPDASTEAFSLKSCLRQVQNAYLGRLQAEEKGDREAALRRAGVSVPTGTVGELDLLLPGLLEPQG